MHLEILLLSHYVGTACMFWISVRQMYEYLDLIALEGVVSCLEKG